jgi:RNA polymerase-binding transcription factor DksA
MSRDELKHYRTELLNLAANLSEELANDRRELRPDDGSNEPSDAGIQEVRVGLIATEEKLLDEVVAALDRIDTGEFSTCEDCGRKIATARLDVLPYARTCVRCARAPKPVAG